MYMRLAPLLWGETRSMQKSVISSDYAPSSCKMWCTIDHKVMLWQQMRQASLLEREALCTGHSLHNHRMIKITISNAVLLHLGVALQCWGTKVLERRLCEAL